MKKINIQFKPSTVFFWWCKNHIEA